MSPDIRRGTPASVAPGHAGAADRLIRAGLAARTRGQSAKAFEEFGKAAATGDPEGQFQLVLLYARGEGVVGSLGDAIVWFRRAAEQCHGEAQYQLSLAYLHGGRADGGVPGWYDGATKVDHDTAERNRQLIFPNESRPDLCSRPGLRDRLRRGAPMVYRRR